MNKNLFIIILVAAAFCAGFFTKTFLTPTANTGKAAVQENNKEKKTQLTYVKMPITKKVSGIGGVFFISKDPKKLNEWYQKHLGMEAFTYGGTRFVWDEKRGDEIIEGSLQWAAFDEKGGRSYYAPSTKDFMINYRVEDMDYLVAELKKEGVTFTDSVQEFEYGKFVHIMDPEGNKIELYQPNYSYAEKMNAKK
ncbi:MAG TPA: VOC family protein [Flavobacteriales bacterium]|nr:VOC family protein [Flavobacteriales bacterium]